jgi:hypothetical protein
LKVSDDAKVDPELATFNENQTEMDEKSRHEHRQWMLQDIATTAGIFKSPR